MSNQDNAALRLLRTPPAPLTVKQQEIQGFIPESSFEDLFDESLTREDVLKRIDPETLRTAPVNLLITTAIAMASSDATEATEDYVLRHREALLSRDLASTGYLRLTAEKFVLADIEYQQAITKCAEIETAYPMRGQFSSESVYIDSCKLYERRMDRLLRSKKESFDRYERAAEVYRVALLTRDGQEVLMSLSAKTRPVTRTRDNSLPNPAHILASNDDHGVEVLTNDSQDTQHVQVFIKVR